MHIKPKKKKSFENSTASYKGYYINTPRLVNISDIFGYFQLDNKNEKKKSYVTENRCCKQFPRLFTVIKEATGKIEN